MSTDYSPASALFVEDPVRAEKLGLSVASQLRELRPDLVVCWDTSEDAVLAHVVARELGCGVRLAVETEGIVALIGDVAVGANVAMVGRDFSTLNAVAALSGVVTNGGASVVAVATTGPRPEVAATAARDAVVVSGSAE